MKKTIPKYPRILAITPSTRGFGFALVEGLNTLVDWGVKNVDADKNTGSLARVKALIAYYEPDVLVLEDASAKPVRRAPRIRELTKRIVSMAKRQDVRVMSLPRKQVRRVFFADGQGTKYALAQILAERFPDELGTRLPPKRRPWMSEDSRMDIFGAVALALAVRRTKP
jgi:RNase H-fold protein (predicted Holliday junction resolvase)